MSAFETISNREDLGDSSQWLSSPPALHALQGDLNPHNELAFRLGLNRIKVFYGQLKDRRHMHAAAADEGSVEFQYMNVLGDALRAISYDPSFRERIYLLRDQEAVDLLDAFQLASRFFLALWSDLPLTY
jgi:hypothetical protein